jgi:hypothetical protein
LGNVEAGIKADGWVEQWCQKPLLHVVCHIIGQWSMVTSLMWEGRESMPFNYICTDLAAQYMELQTE